MATAIISDKSQQTKLVESKSFSKFTAFPDTRITLINEVLPFRIKITNIGIDAYGPNNVPPIGIAIVGLNNYIL